MNNPFIVVPTIAWLVFVLTLCVGTPKPWAWMVYVPWLTIATAAPIVWWAKQRKEK